MKKKVFLIRDLSNESNQAEEILKDNGISPMIIMSFSEDSYPTLITEDNSYSITGIEEIKEYAEKNRISIARG